MGKMIAAILAGGKGTRMDFFARSGLNPHCRLPVSIVLLIFVSATVSIQKSLMSRCWLTTGVANWLIILIVGKMATP